MRVHRASEHLLLDEPFRLPGTRDRPRCGRAGCRRTENLITHDRYASCGLTGAGSARTLQARATRIGLRPTLQ
ncbi:MAG: hypothetical protein A3G25_05255 [Betaproteobacteria bacterium RIFCSPLOWO2_12_FULL_63_13]|nr:MAG: hypothetical protein A3H32_16730 [Betaproteobacteria bacterium RIFCSPLOWO2_02_FULL_63_19]OGA51572.1 MAG: hypothetical protein A3G25_05255 [Betaproteobacteria bacterium RIFCSPLOWO2_12_FULL_63_13]